MDVDRALPASMAKTRVLRPAVWLFTGILLTLLASCSSSQPENLHGIRQTGELRVAVPIELIPADQKLVSGFDLNLVQGLAKKLGTSLRLVPVQDEASLLTAVTHGYADIAIAVPQSMALEYKQPHSPVYQSIRYVVVGKNGQGLASNLVDIRRELRVSAGSAASLQLLQEKKNLPMLSWTESRDGTEELFGQVIDERIAYTVISDHSYNVLHHRYPDARIAFALEQTDALTWVYSNHNTELNKVADRYLNAHRMSGELATLREQTLQPLLTHDYLDRRALARAVVQRLPALQQHFEIAAQDNLEWRFLAAMAYQESHWREQAISGTGVVGIMMLTEETAEHIGVKDRRDPAQSIRGGADYFRSLLARLPDRIQNEDRIALALAAYNIGFMHLEDARILTARRGDNKDRWADVKKHLPDLRTASVYNQLRYGYARGDEAVEFVDNVLRYHSALRWLNPSPDETLSRRMAGGALATERVGDNTAATRVAED